MQLDDRLQATARRLDNGLTVLVREIRTAPLVSVWCWYRVGSGDERSGLTGVSHWCEHMNFKGTRNIPRDQVKGLIDKYGGFWNGYTWIDQTTYMETASTDALDQMLFIEAERMSGCLYDPDDCASERTVIISELQGNENDPDHLLDTEVTATALRVHPYRHPTIGWIGDLETMTREDLYGHYQRHYVPANATLVIVGDVDTDDALRRAEQAFGAIDGGTRPDRARTAEPPQRGERRVTVRRPGTTAYLKVAYPSPASSDADFAPMLILDAVLTGAHGLNIWSSFRGTPPQRRARLYRALVDGGLAAGVSSACLPTADPYLLTLSITVADGRALEDVEAATLAAVDEVATSGITEAELERAQRQLRARMVFENDSVTNVAHQLGYFQTVGGLDTFVSLPERIAAVTVDDVGRVAASALRRDARTVGWFQPES